MLPAHANRTEPRPVCLACAGIPENYQCRTCHTEGQIYRHRRCARCALREDLSSLIVDGAADPAAMGTIVDILCGVDRPESILTWKLSPTVQALLTGLSCGDIPLSHDGLDAAGRSRQVSHLRSLLEHNGLLPPRDEHLARFESWLASALDHIPDSAVRAPVEQFATWHHLRRLRRNSTPGQASDGPRHSAQQQITETIKFLTWLHHTHHRTAATCPQQDVDEWLATGPTTRHRSALSSSWAKKSKINTAVRLENQQAKTIPPAHPGPATGMDQRTAHRRHGITSLPRRGHTGAALRPTTREDRRTEDDGHRHHPARDTDIPWRRTHPGARTLRRHAQRPSKQPARTFAPAAAWPPPRGSSPAIGREST